MRFEIKEEGQKRAIESRGRILSAAAKAFSTQTYESVTIREIAFSAKVKHQLIAYYFGSKEALWLKVIEMLYEEFLQVGSLESGSLTSGSQFRSHLKKMISYIYEKPELLKILIREMGNSGPRFVLVKNQMLQFVKVSYKVFDEAKKMGYFKGIANEELYFILSGAMMDRIIYPEMNKLVTGSEMNQKQLDAHIDALVKFIS